MSRFLSVGLILISTVGLAWSKDSTIIHGASIYMSGDTAGSSLHLSGTKYEIGRYKLPPLTAVPASRDTFLTYALVYSDMTIFSYADSNECTVLNPEGQTVWSGMIMDGKYILLDSLYGGVYAVRANKEYSILSGDSRTAGFGAWVALDNNSRPLSTRLLSQGAGCVFADQEIGPNEQVMLVFAYQDSTHVKIMNIDVDTLIWEGYLDSACYYYYRHDIHNHQAFNYSVVSSKPVSSMTNNAGWGFYAPSYNGTFTGTDFLTYTAYQYDLAGSMPMDLQVVPWEDNTTVTVTDLEHQYDTIWKMFFPKKGIIKGIRVPLPGDSGRALYIHSDKDISVPQVPWTSYNKDAILGFSYVHGIDRDGLGIGREFHIPLELSYYGLASRLFIFAYRNNTHVKVTRTPRDAAEDDKDEDVLETILNEGEYVEYLVKPFGDMNGFATYHVITSEPVSTIGSCHNHRGADFLPHWSAVHPDVGVGPSPQYEETECAVPVEYKVRIGNNGNSPDIVNILPPHNSGEPDFVTALSDSLGGALHDADSDGNPDTDTLRGGSSFLVNTEVTPSDTVPFGTLDTCFFEVISWRDFTKHDTALLITRIREVDIDVEPDTIITAYPGDVVAIPVRATNTSLYREDTVNLDWSSTRNWSVRLATTAGEDLFDSDGDGLPDVAGVEPDSVPYPFRVSVTVPDSALPGDNDTIYLTGVSANYPLRLYPGVLDTAVLIIDVIAAPSIVIRPDTTDSVVRGTAILYYLEVINNGNDSDTPRIVPVYKNHPDWGHMLLASDGKSLLPDTDGDGTPDMGSLPGRGGMDTLCLEVLPPYSALPGQLDSCVVYAHSSVFDSVYDSAIVVTRVRGIVKLDIEPNSSMTIGPGESAEYTLEVTNWGGAPDTVEIWSYASPDLGWSYSLTNMSGGALTDYDNDGILDVGSVDSSEVKQVLLTVTPPAILGSIQGAFDTTVIESRYVLIKTRYTSNPNLVNDSVSITTIFQPSMDIHNYPNPFSGTTTFAYSIPGAGNVSLRIYNRAGEHVRTLIDNEAFSLGGMYECYWDGQTGEGKRPAPGVYLYTLEWTPEDATGIVKTRRIVKKALMHP